MKPIGIRSSVLLVLPVLLALFCSNPTNPYLDSSLSRAAVSTKSFTDKDTISIFSRETLSVVIYLKEHVKSVAVHVDHNRLWTHADTNLSVDSYSGTPIAIPFSFYDTGWQQIEVKTELYKGKIITEKYSLYARSPLYQKSISGGTGDIIDLKTEPVLDDQVLYVWNFHDGLIVKEYKNETSTILKNDLVGTVGELYVSDPLYRSPSVAFSIGAGSAPVLSLACVNDSVVEDSVYTGQANFEFKVEVNGAEQLKKASVNGSSFDNIWIQKGSVLISKTISRLDTVTGTLRAIVYAEADKGSITKTFYIHYNSAIKPPAPQIHLTIPTTIRDTGYVIESQVPLNGTISGVASTDSAYLHVIVNGATIGSYKLVSNATTWSYPVKLVPGWNTLLLQLTQDSTLSGSILAVTIVQLNYSANAVDIVAPKINSISIDGIALGSKKSIVSRSEKVLVTVLASDNKRVTSVTINGEAAMADTTGLSFKKQLVFAHVKNGQPFILLVKDSAGNSTSDTITGLYNHPPKITDISFPSTMIADSNYVFTVHASDADSDSLLSTMTIKSATLDTVVTFRSNTVKFRPARKDTGTVKIRILVSDSFSESIDSAFEAAILYKANKTMNVAWRTVKEDLPDSILVGEKPLSILLRVDTLTGTAPFRFTITLDTSSVKLYEGTDPAFTWTPQRGDAGLRSLRCIVTDAKGLTDTLNKLIKVVARPAATVWLEKQLDTISEGSKTDSISVRLSKPLRDPVVIRYKIALLSATIADIGFDTIGVMVILPGDTLVKLAIPMVDDTIQETDEKFTLLLTPFPALSAKDSLFIEPTKSSETILIKDNDKPTKVGVMLQPDYIVSSIPEGANLKIPYIVLTAALPFDITVTVKPTAASTATLGGSSADYVIANQKVVVKAGSLNAQMEISILTDTIKEPMELIELEISEISDLTKAYISDQKTVRIQINANN